LDRATDGHRPWRCARHLGRLYAPHRWSHPPPAKAALAQVGTAPTGRSAYPTLPTVDTGLRAGHGCEAGHAVTHNEARAAARDGAWRLRRGGCGAAAAPS